MGSEEATSYSALRYTPALRCCVHEDPIHVCGVLDSRKFESLQLLYVSSTLVTIEVELASYSCCLSIAGCPTFSTIKSYLHTARSACITDVWISTNALRLVATAAPAPAPVYSNVPFAAPSQKQPSHFKTPVGDTERNNLHWCVP